MLPIVLVLLFAAVKAAQGQCPIGTTMSFEKIASVTIRGVPFVPLYNGQPDIPVTAECNNRCRAGSKCRAFLLSYDKHQCFGFDYDSLSRSLSMVSTTEKTSYFEKICLSTAPCEKAWTFERVMGRELKGFDNRVLSGVASRLRCQELCLKERSFICRSGEYDYVTQQCKLSSEDRRSQPTAFRLAPTSSIDYFENQCATTQQAQLASQQTATPPAGVTSTALGSSSPTPVTCEFDRYENLDIRRADLIRTAFSIEQCKGLCEATRAFVCRSFTYATATNQCWLSSDDILAVSAGITGLESHAGATYFQRQHCLDLQLFCSHDSMTVSLNTIDPFNGRLYSKEDPAACESMGRSATNTLLTLPFNQRSCGVREEDGKYTSMVVIQHHPMIQRKGDRIVHVACHFEATNRTISNTYSVLVEMPSVAETSIVNATAPSPNIRLRITDKEGQDITGARLGDELYLRIELDDDEVFGIFARELIAKSGANANESIMLIDNHGCPADPNIFPTLERIPNSKGLMGKFDAFKFADDVVVRFQVNVQFCLQECTPVQCDNSRHADSEALKTTRSWGRRRRRDTEDQAGPNGAPILGNQTELHREIIVEGMKNKGEALKTGEQQRIQDEKDSMVCTSKVTLIMGLITMVMLEVTIFGSCLACFLLYKRIPGHNTQMAKLSEAAKRAGGHHHRSAAGRGGLAHIIDGLRVESLLSSGRKPYMTHLENEDCLSTSGSSCCSGDRVGGGAGAGGGSLNKSSGSLYSSSSKQLSSSASSPTHHTRSSYPAPKSQQMWSHINRIE